MKRFTLARLHLVPRQELLKILAVLGLLATFSSTVNAAGMIWGASNWGEANWGVEAVHEPVPPPSGPVPAATKIQSIDGTTSDAEFGMGAYSATGEPTYLNDFVVGDYITVIGTITPDPDDVGKNGELYAAIKSVVDGKVSLTFLNEDGNFEAWNLTVEGLGPAQIATPLEDFHSLTIFEGSLSAGKHNIYMAYKVDGGPLIFTGKALKLVVSE